MTTTTEGARPGIPLRRDPITLQMPRVDQIEREARLKRLGLVGALALFMSFFGLTVALDYRDQDSAATGSAPAVIYVEDPNAPAANPPTALPRPRVRTRSS